MSTEYKTLSGAAFIRWLVAQGLVGEGTVEVTIMASRFGPVRIDATGKGDDRLTQGGVLTQIREEREAREAAAKPPETTTLAEGEDGRTIRVPGAPAEWEHVEPGV